MAEFSRALERGGGGKAGRQAEEGSRVLNVVASRRIVMSLETSLVTFEKESERNCETEFAESSPSLPALLFWRIFIKTPFLPSFSTIRPHFSLQFFHC